MEWPVHLKLSAIQAVALGCLVLAAGIWLKGRVRILDRLNIPAAVLGGLLFSTLALFSRRGLFTLELDTTLRDLLMIVFFTAVGLCTRWRILKVGGLQVGLLLTLATVLAVVQNLIGIGIAKLFGLHPLIGIVAGSVSLTGGPATSLAFGPTFEAMGVQAATVVALAAATFGIVSGGLLGGPIGTRLIESRGLRNRPSSRWRKTGQEITEALNPAQGERAAFGQQSPGIGGKVPILPEELEGSGLIRDVAMVAVSMGVGSVLSGWISARGFVLPSYIGAMIAAGIFRNVNDALGWTRLSDRNVETIGNISLSIFIAIALIITAMAHFFRQP
ncbi:MAG: sodium/glutamate symporter [Acidobacteria bacterium]|nr:sodium/glutamate symporter [Acidobacteriota bacterium]